MMVNQSITLLVLFCIMVSNTFARTTDELIEQIGNTENPELLDALVNQLTDCQAGQPETTIPAPSLPGHTPEHHDPTPVTSNNTFLTTLEAVKKNNPALLDLFMRHHSIISNQIFIEMPRTNPYYFPSRRAAFTPHLVATLASYTTLAQQFFTTTPPYTAEFTYQLTQTSLELEFIKNDYARGVFWTLILGKPNIPHILEKVLGIIWDIRTIAMHDQMPKKPSLLEAFLAHEWTQKITKVIQHPNGTFSLDVAHSLLKNKQFKDLQTLGMYALAYTTPSLFDKLMNYFKPSLKREEAACLDVVQGKTHATDEVAKRTDFLLEFVNNHPDLFAQISEQHPEIVNLLALQLKKLVEPAHKV